ncbi:MAG: hypothetical protein A3C06_00565 [Candidatus Taylorbacteria bacterium RIFCSPHIGHO2_02_FULL_46_13]|uniref:Uncharacterized protein n=1 Tax=Candidatus Taylorbacteria bacterium RIFCSPHIGHO2_02_FULL_46_13 TaxID=1802312 RepID=A0A1G2MTX6_9BACT|nr:MAG: hypothetical protein A3C06_00565 [Candidatus Taylorbacteria bacterium RIFCSPHIGHO2_02_FULL_46_13]
MRTVNLTQTQYEALKDRAEAYERLMSAAKQELFSPPPTRSGKRVIKTLRASGRYSRSFLESLERGIQRSRFFTD